MPDNKKIEFQDLEVKAAFEIPTEVTADFQVRLPSLQWSGMFSEITLPVAQQLVKEKYNHIRIIPQKK